MSCYRPLELRTNTLHYNVQQFSNTLPCGKCEGCQSSRIFDYKKRTLYEFNKCKDKGGFTLLVTLTYNDKYLPRVPYLGKNLPTFLKKDIQSFIKHFRKAFEKTFLPDIWLSPEPFRYFQVCEYGDEYGRPHYHVLFHFYIPYDAITTVRIIKGLIYQNWTRKITLKKPYTVQRTYIHNGKKKIYKYKRKTMYPHLGFVQIAFSEANNTYVVTDDKALGYVCDYLHKDFYFIGTHNPLIDALNDDDRAEFLRVHGPFHLNSLSYGDISSCLSDYDIQTGTSILTINGIKDRYPLSRYLQRKVYYTLHKDKTYHLNYYGISYKLSKVSDLRANFRQNVAVALSYPDVSITHSPTSPSATTIDHRVTRAIEYMDSVIADFGLTFICNYYLCIYKRFLTPHLINHLTSSYTTPIDFLFSDQDTDNFLKSIYTFDSQYAQHSLLFDSYPYDCIKDDKDLYIEVLNNYDDYSIPRIDIFISRLNFLLSKINDVSQTYEEHQYYYKHSVKPLIKQRYGQIKQPPTH